MKTLIPGKAKVIQKSDRFIGPYNLLEIFFHISELKTDVTLQLAKESIEDSMDIFNSELVALCETMMDGSVISITKDNKVTELTPRKLAFIVSDLAFGALQRGSEGNKSPFKVEIIAPNVAIKEFKKTNKNELADLERLQKQLGQKQPTNLDIMEAIKNIKFTEQPNVIVSNFPIQGEPSVVTTKTTKQNGDGKYTKRADLDFLGI